MSGKDLFEGMSYVDERFVHEAEHQTIAKRNVTPWIKWASLAACIWLILFGAWNLYIGQGSEHGISAGNFPVGGDPSDSIMDATIPLPAQPSASEFPSVILRVDSTTENGFVGTVARLVDTEVFDVGMELNVVIIDGTMTVDNQTVGSSKAFLPGSYVMVQFIEYDRESGTIIINIIQEANLPEMTPEKGR